MQENTTIAIAAAGITVFLEEIITYPLDRVKTCLQLQRKLSAGSASPAGTTHYYYTGIVDCVGTVYRRESFLSLWKGVVPPLLIETPRRTVNFLIFEQYHQNLSCGSLIGTPLTYYAAGLCVGLTESFVINPFEVVKISLQTNRLPLKEAPSTLHVVKKIVEKQGYGLNGLYRGVTATMISHGIFKMVFFGVYYSLKGYLQPLSNQTLNVFDIMGIGLAAGTLASIVNNPFDVAKTRIQGPQPGGGIPKYKAPLSTVATIYREERMRALLKGVYPKVLRKGFGGALLAAANEYVYYYLTDVFTK